MTIFQKRIKEAAVKEVGKLVNDPLWLTGVILYWGEGTKEHGKSSDVEICNMNINIHHIFIKWCIKFLKIKKDDFRYAIYIHEKANIQKAQNYWCTELKIIKEELKIYLKRHNPKTKRKP